MQQVKFFSGSAATWRVALVGAAIYVALLILLRLAGKRALAKMNAYDMVVTVALGSTLASAILSPDVSFLDGVTAFAVLLGLQRLVTLVTTRSHRARVWVNSVPVLVLYRGEMLQRELRRHQLSEEEILAALRNHGHARVEDVFAVVLETDGEFSVIARDPTLPATALRDVAGIYSESPDGTNP
ncbi:MAG TPA: YetF domain-containing protein [Gemmatimonadales bacterium]|nr:YetF domain-containing protein [Gemmatimonadales bacterium]